ncbi:putative Serine/threonine-protein kinase mTOR [Hypsibius exemplaris]|uniref:Serine/threonine-protein kinase mTOR n=1 Tax=Hypsibius exemplaris TaxID=2072580 RepID=A0A1W0WKH3_HYPEX|nr:putative Serine/threonine-protein kinase mTOR [Hypsibius exemplaris]
MGGTDGDELSLRYDPSPVGSLRYSSDAGSVDGESTQPDAVNKKAVAILNRVRDKLGGHDFLRDAIEVPKQFDLLIGKATSHENLCQCYIGWCPFW